MADPVRLCGLADLAEAAPRRFEVGKAKLCVVRLGGRVYAIGDTCSHAEVSLSEGEVDDGHVECWKHGSRFSLETGEPDALPATKPVPTYEVRLDGDDVLVVV